MKVSLRTKQKITAFCSVILICAMIFSIYQEQKVASVQLHPTNLASNPRAVATAQEYVALKNINTSKELEKKPKTTKPSPKITKKKSSSTISPKIIQMDFDTTDLGDETVQFIPNTIPESEYPHIFRVNYPYLSDGFDFPVGKPNALGYYKSQNFGDRLHLGEDWNGKGGGNTDLGDPVYATANGLVTFAQNVCCGWGNTIRLIHCQAEDPNRPYVESVYSHLLSIEVNVGDMVKRGQKIGTIGTAEGKYIAHLHFEMREFINMSLGPGYSDDQMGYLDPTPYIKANRPY